MNGIDPVTLTHLLTKVERNLDTHQTPSTMGALVTVNADRSAWKNLLGVAKDKLARR